jgi:hypothetical protein
MPSSVVKCATRSKERALRVLQSAAQGNNSAADAFDDKILLRTSTMTGKDGFYKLLLQSGTYHIVAANTNYEPSVRCFVELQSGDALQALDSELADADKETVALHLKIEAAEEDLHARSIFRQLFECADSPIDIEITEDR